MKTEGVQPVELSDVEVILNINAGHKHKYCVLILDCEEEKDGIMFGFGLLYCPDIEIYIHLPLELLDELIEKYSLHSSHEKKVQSIDKFFINGDVSLN